MIDKVAREIDALETPSPVVDLLIEVSELASGLDVLEPFAGRGALASRVGELCRVDCIERDPANVAVLRAGGYARRVIEGDFLAIRPRANYDRVVMHPPLGGRWDVAHVRHALDFLRPDGLLVAIVPRGPKGAIAPRELCEEVYGLAGGFHPLETTALAGPLLEVPAAIAVVPKRRRREADVMSVPLTDAFPLLGGKPLRQVVFEWPVTTTDDGSRVSVQLVCTYGRDLYEAWLNNVVVCQTQGVKVPLHDLAILDEQASQYRQEELAEFARCALEELRARSAEVDVMRYLRGEPALSPQDLVQA